MVCSFRTLASVRTNSSGMPSNLATVVPSMRSCSSSRSHVTSPDFIVSHSGTVIVNVRVCSLSARLLADFLFLGDAVREKSRVSAASSSELDFALTSIFHSGRTPSTRRACVSRRMKNPFSVEIFICLESPISLSVAALSSSYSIFCVASDLVAAFSSEDFASDEVAAFSSVVLVSDEMAAFSSVVLISDEVAAFSSVVLVSDEVAAFSSVDSTSEVVVDTS